jgi:hypothetical protein
MNTKAEFEKIERIFASKIGAFSYRGIVCDFDEIATMNLPINANLHGKPIRKLVGKIPATGETITVWSHDVIALGKSAEAEPEAEPKAESKPKVKSKKSKK